MQQSAAVLPRQTALNVLMSRVGRLMVQLGRTHPRKRLRLPMRLASKYCTALVNDPAALGVWLPRRALDRQRHDAGVSEL